MKEDRVEAGLRALARLAEATVDQRHTIVRLAGLYEDTLRSGGTLYFAGNGGSAADAQHLAAEYVVRYERTRRGLAAVALTTDTSILTAESNDVGFEFVFARQVEALCEQRDLLILHSTSGQSPNLLRAAEAAKSAGAKVVAFVGQGGHALARLADITFEAQSAETSHVQEIQLAVEHLIVGLVEESVAGS
ncbi:MAG: SIS domain-containing protein [Gemmatimonadales bacterium]|nr:SIS domain-containing protein [Gemmatimonadales bacterium]